jgi:hypothetical protein
MRIHLPHPKTQVIEVQMMILACGIKFVRVFFFFGGCSANFYFTWLIAVSVISSSLAMVEQNMEEISGHDKVEVGIDGDIIKQVSGTV